jgi:ankyrin repeat protein
MIRVLLACAAKLVDTSNGEAFVTLRQADDLLQTLAVVIDLLGADGEEGTSVFIAHRRLLNVAEVIRFVTMMALEALTPSTIVHSLGSAAVRTLLYKGALDDTVWRVWSFGAPHGALSPTDEPSGRRLLRVADAGDEQRDKVVESRRGEPEVTLRDFASPGCGYASEDPECSPTGSVAVGMTYVRDSSYIYLGLGHEEFRRGAVEAGWPLSDQDKVHTVSGILSVTGRTGPLVPELAIQLPLDLQTGMADLREDNKFCCRIDYERMQLLFLGGVKTSTVVHDYPGGWTIQQHIGLCWADMYGDYVLVQISRPPKMTVARDFVTPRKSNSSAIILPPLPPSTALSIDTLRTITFGVGAMILVSIVLAAGVNEFCRARPRRRARQTRTLRFAKLPSSVDGEGHCSGEVVDSADNSFPLGEHLPSRMERFESTDQIAQGGEGDMWAVGILQQSFSRASSVGFNGLSLPGSAAGSCRELGVPSSLRNMINISSRRSSTLHSPLTSDGGYGQLYSLRHLRIASVANSYTAGAMEWPSTRRNDIEFPLHAAARSGNTSHLSSALLTVGSDINAPDNTGRTALHLAAKAGHAEAVQCLLDLLSSPHDGEGAALDPNIVDGRGHTPLHLAAAYDHTSVVETLIGINVPATSTGGLDQTMYDEVTELKMSSMMKSDFENDVSTTSKAEGSGEIAGTTSVVQVNRPDAYGCTPLHIAAHFGCAEAMAALLRGGADIAIRMKDRHGNTPLHLAAMNGHTGCLLMMLRHCLKDTRSDWLLAKNLHGHVPADVATVRGYGATVEALLLWGEQEGVNVTRPHGDGISLMSLATFHGKRTVSRVIRSNEWWMWEAAPEEVVLDGDLLRRRSAFSTSFKEIVRQTNGRLSDAKEGISRLVSSISNKYIRGPATPDAGYEATDIGDNSDDEALPVIVPVRRSSTDDLASHDKPMTNVKDGVDGDIVEVGREGSMIAAGVHIALDRLSSLEDISCQGSPRSPTETSALLK